MPAWSRLLFSFSFSCTVALSASTVMAQDAEPEIDGGAPSDAAPPAPDAPIGPPPPPPPTYPQYPGQPAVGYDATASPADDVVPEVDVVATADAPTPAATEHEHRGFFLRPHVGFGYVTASGQGTELRGLGFSAGIMIGAAIVKNLVLFGEFAFQVVGSGKYEGPVRPGPGETVGLAAAVFGGGVAYYIMPYNLHASVAVDYLAMQITVGERALLLDPSGFAFHVTLGKEWYVSRRLGLGLAAQALLGFVGDYTLFGIGLAGTLTFD